MVSGSMFCSLKNPRSIATKYGSEDAVGNTPTFTLSCATAVWPEPAIKPATRTTIVPSVFNPSFGIVTPPSTSGFYARDDAALGAARLRTGEQHTRAPTSLLHRSPARF